MDQQKYIHIIIKKIVKIILKIYQRKKERNIIISKTVSSVTERKTKKFLIL